MKQRKIQFAAVTLALLCAGGLAGSAQAQGRARVIFVRVQAPAPWRIERVQAPQPVPPFAQPLPQERRMLNLPPRWVEQLRNMSPEDQQRFLSNNQRFLELPPMRQQQIRRQLQIWNNLPPEQRQAILERQEVWERLTPPQQAYVRDTLLPVWRSMLPVRRQLILKKLRDLKGLDDSQRAARLNDGAFLYGLGPREQKMLRDLADLRVTGPLSEPGSEPPGL